MPTLRLIFHRVMRSLNSPPILNALESKIVETLPTDARHILVVNAGDGRLPRALRDKLGSGVVISLVSLQAGLAREVDDFESPGTQPWDFEWYAARTAAHGAFDAVVLYQMHEFWHGELRQLQRLLGLACPGALVWTSFLNSQANRMIARFLPPIRLGFSSLADPTRLGANIDFASYLDFVSRIGAGLVELWGLLDQNAQEYCQKQPAQPVQWESRGTKVTIGTIADAFLWGAAVVGFAFRLPGGPAAPPAPNVSFSSYGAALLQALTLPYPDLQTSEGVLAGAQFEIEAWRKKPAAELGSLPKLLLDRVGEAGTPRRVLLVGCGWGRDLLWLKRHYPLWEWVGWERRAPLLEMGRELLAEGGVTAVSSDWASPLPFDAGAFDIAISLGCFSTLYEPAARHLAREVRRVTKGAIHHLEDGRGPKQAMQLKSYSLKAVYSEIGCESTVQPVLSQGEPTGMYLLAVPAPA